MISVSEYTKREYGEKLYKISLNAGFGCPNRENGQHGCIFCSQGGSGDFAVDVRGQDLEEKIAEAKAKVASKFKGNRYIAYFQAYTNTYAPVEVLRSVFMPIIMRDDVAVLSIATRPDCLDDDVYALLEELRKIKPVWVELGLQTTKAESIAYIRRGYENEVYDEAIKRLNTLDIHTITHVILYLPGESKEDMYETIRHVVRIGSKGIKLQLLQVLKNTDMEKDFFDGTTPVGDFYFPTLEEYGKMIEECLSIIKKEESHGEEIVIHRLTGDAPKKLLIEPKWVADKKRVLNEITNRVKND